MVIAVPFSVKGWHAPAGRRTRETPASCTGQADRPAAPVGARTWDPADGSLQRQPRRGVSRLAGQAGSQARHYAQITPKPGKQGRVGHTPPILPAEYGVSRGRLGLDAERAPKDQFCALEVHSRPYYARTSRSPVTDYRRVFLTLATVSRTRRRKRLSQEQFTKVRSRAYLLRSGVD
jgi:hypothetical protein